MNFTPSSIAALIVSACFAAGLNLYATIATLGILSHFHWVLLPPGLDSLAHPWVIVVACLLFALEFVADKIPGFDLLWNAAHTFIRIPMAALLAYKAASQLSPEMQLLAAAAGAGLSALAHVSKTSARVLVTPSPEPASNIALSTAEDAGAIGITWLATHHPYTAASITAVTALLLILSARWIIRRTRRSFANLKSRWSRRRGRSVAARL